MIWLSHRRAKRAKAKALDWVVEAATEVNESATRSQKPYYDLVHTYAMESLNAALSALRNPEVER